MRSRLSSWKRWVDPDRRSCTAAPAAAEPPGRCPPAPAPAAKAAAKAGGGLLFPAGAALKKHPPVRARRYRSSTTELVISKVRLVNRHDEPHAGATETLEQMDRVTTDLQGVAMKGAHEVPVSQVFNRFPRMVATSQPHG